jgi:[histone H3]-lysine36 N-dimethyltransferase SETMAR
MSGVIYFELLDINETITADVYSQQLQRLNEVLLQKRPTLANQKDVILLHDNSRSHVAKLTQQKIEQLGWEVLLHPPWSPDLSHQPIIICSYLFVTICAINTMKTSMS